MLLISELKNYTEEVVQAIASVKKGKVVVTVDDLFKFMKEHTAEDNILMIALVPEHGVNGSEDAVQWENMTGFYFMDKTDYSAHDYDSYLAIFERTQAAACEFVEKLLTDKSEGCNLFRLLEQDSISISPVKNLESCNGYFVQLSMGSKF
ncbi:MAG: hypothetical protein BM557_01340 [Flavobacterium sp. MedPE-SWcel]|uniref:hypothetical protein n=1 Tax=uncultured Flavobacterium sp. TaxID=165435 RepID=UPI00091BFBA0|nr:hypothetical protein [uncultured Flavobacterium sp.]OIQ22050.1 MAG: hypothetical protein BM557_01340 [Flavobacterium sp. MedPE-SWcel]